MQSLWQLAHSSGTNNATIIVATQPVIPAFAGMATVCELPITQIPI